MENNESGKAGGSTTFSGQRVVILGGTSGVGLATAEAAAQEGAAVVVASSRQASVDRAIARLPKSAEGHLVDLSSEQPIRDFFGRIGAFDHLVFTAGEALRLGPLESTDTDAARKFFNLRYWGALMAVKYGSPHIRRGGSITLTTGTAGRRPEKGWTVAASITGAMESLTRALAVELAPIRVNAVCPGIVRTELWSGIPAAEREALFEKTGKSLLVGRVGEASDLAQSYLFLMREGFSTGQVVVVDGGGALV